ncbi:MAG: hypothetical protein N7Q72_07730, partial [Spiroplasma sp. Tabriz.8]|nr:hypothetical protein [Spiroplasma sp. Tabriz.8]
LASMQLLHHNFESCLTAIAAKKTKKTNKQTNKPYYIQVHISLICSVVSISQGNFWLISIPKSASNCQ